MSILCPYCQHAMNVKSVKPGRFKPKCAKCGLAFLLTVADDQSMTAAALPDSKPAVTSDPDATKVPEPSAPAPKRPTSSRVPVSKKPAPDPDATATPPDESHKEKTNPDATVTPNESNVPTKPSDASEEEDAKRDPSMPDVLGNYEIVKRLGAGAMGAVYLARQVSLDRPVALKVMKRQWAKNPIFVVRFTREAYAAAQLVHHNVVQVYDIGADKGIHYFSMEFVEGSTLGSLLQKKGKLEAKAAGGYVLQAARGLKFAHDRGMVHRDVKPDNLMLNTHGLVKVADLGLVRTPGTTEEKLDPDATELTPKKGKVASQGMLSSFSGVTMANQAIGTPSYMAPEQARDATSVDERADIYSLGCTLYVLLTGKPVFEGHTVLEVIMKHLNEPVTPPENREKTVPKELSAVILKALAKNPDERYANTGEFIAALEGFLGVGGEETKPGEEHLEILEAGIKVFRDAPAVKLRARVLLGFYLCCGAACLLCLILGWWIAAASALGLGVLTALGYFIVNGIQTRTPLFLKVRAYVLSSGVFDWLKAAFALLLVLGILYFVGLLWALLVVCVAAATLAFGFHFVLDRLVEKQREGALERVEKMLKTFRVKGMAEDAIQEFVCIGGGDQWEEVFEELFGYEAKLAARSRWGDGPKGTRRKFAAWRDPLVRWLDARQRARQEARERKYLQAIEQKNLRAQGVSDAEAKRKAELVAEAMVQKAAEIKQEAALVKSNAPTLAAVDAEGVRRPAPPKRINLRELYEMSAEPAQVPRRQSRMLAKLGGFVFGGQLRFLLGALLLFVSLAWLHTSKLTDEVKKASLTDLNAYQQFWTKAERTPALAIPLVPETVLRPLSSLAAGIAGFFLILSAFQSLRWLALFELALSAGMILGPMLGVPEVGPLSPALVYLAGGAALWLVALFIGWRMQR